MRPIVYLSGPIAGCTDEECRAWREYVKSIAKDHKIKKCIDPMTRDFREFDDKPIDAQVIRDIVVDDKFDIDRSNVLLANYLPTKRCVGTVMEILYAYERGKLVVVVCPENYHPSPWIMFHSHYVCWNLDEAVRYIHKRFV